MKLGFIAISGLRLVDQPLLDLGLSFPDVFRRAKEIQALPSLGLLTLAGMCPPEIHCSYHEVRDFNEALPDFDAVLLSTLTATSKEAYRWAARFRQAGTKVLLGGLHATLSPDEAKTHVDALIIGEGEPVWPTVLSDLQTGQLQPVYDARLLPPFDFNHSPMPAFELLEPDRYPRFTVQTQRGCPLACEFCAASMRLSPKFRVKPVERVVAEIKRLKSLFRRPFIEFADDNTFADKKHGRALMKALIPENIRFFTETDISVADDLELLDLMRQAGCKQVLIGFESPSAERLNGIELKSNWKSRRAEQYLDAIQRIQSHGITVNGCFIVGLDGDDMSCFDGIYDFVQASGLYDVQVTLLTPFPGTPLWQRLSDTGRLLDPTATEKATLFDINYQPLNLSVDELRQGFLNLIQRLYTPEFVEEREKKFRNQWRQGRLNTKINNTNTSN